MTARNHSSAPVQGRIPSRPFTSARGRFAWARWLGTLGVVVVGLLGSWGVARAADGGEKPTLWAIVVGINEQEDRRIPNCPNADQDAQALVRWLTDRQRGGWLPTNVIKMDKDSRRKPGAPNQALQDLYPDRDNLEFILRKWLPGRLRPNDIVLFAWFGQAAGLARQPDARPGTPGRHYLVPIDARADNLDGTGWRLENALDDLGAQGSNPIVVWLDTSLKGRGEAWSGADDEAANSVRWLNALTRWPTVSVWLSADGKPATEGTFLKALSEGLGTAAAPRNLTACLDRLNRNPALVAQGFRTAGGLPLDLTLWSKELGPLQVAPEQIILQHGHADRVMEVVVLPDGTTAVTASADSTVKYWRLADRTLLRSLGDHMIGVTALALSPDGRRLASGDGQGRALVWSLPEFRLLTPRVSRPHPGGVGTITFVDDGKHFVSLDATGTVLLWDVSGTEAVSTKFGDRANAIASGGGRIAVATAPLNNESRLRIHGVDGAVLRELPGPGGMVVTGGLALRDDLLAVGDRLGHVNVWDLATGKSTATYQLDRPVEALKFVGAAVVVGGPGVVRLLATDHSEEIAVLTVDGTVDQLAVSPDQTAIAVTTEAGAVHAWELTGPSGPKALALKSDEAVIATSLGFGPGGRSLLVGCQEGALRTFDLPSGVARPKVPEHRGRIAALAASPDGLELLQITLDRQAFLWDLRDGRDLKPITGHWTSGTYTPDGMSLVMTDASGEVVLVDRASRSRGERSFQRPRTANGEGVSRTAFRRVAVSPDGRWVAGAAADADLACLWELKTGTLVRTVREHPEGTVAIAFSQDSRSWMTVGTDGTAFAWPLGAEGGPIWSFTSDGALITAAGFDPTDPRRVFTGHDDGMVVRWEIAADGTSRSATLERLDGAVLALSVSDDGKWLACGGDEKAVHVVPLSGPNPPLRLTPRHDERISALVAWAGTGLLVSGSEDATVRLWRLDDQALRGDKALLGTLAAVVESGDWVAFSPEGRFDSSPGAEERVTFLRDGKVLPLNQFYERFRSFRLTNVLRQGQEWPNKLAYDVASPPGLAIDRLAPVTARRQVELALTLGESELTNLRLYLNGVPVREGEDFLKPDPNDPRRRIVTAPLRHGENSLYVMAGRAAPGSIEGRSNTVEIQCQAPEVAGRMHVLALGVDAYPNRRLKFSKADAESIARFLNSNPAQAANVSAGTVSVLTNDKVTPDNLRNALLDLRDTARPEDTVVVFMAGHTDVRRDEQGRERFCLLLPGFPFPKLPRELRPMLAQRGPGGDVGAPDTPKTVLPYSFIYQYLIRIEALQRVIILDACSAESAVLDPGSRQMQENYARKVDDDAHQARTTYLLASRCNEPAFEDEALGHGLLTHVLLRGMGASDLRPDPRGITLPSADGNTDGIITTAELRRYVDDHLPALASRVAPLAMRAGPNVAERAGADDQTVLSPPEAPVGLRVQAGPDGGAFPLVRAPGGD